MRTKFFLFILLILPGIAAAQDATATESTTSLSSDPLFPMYLVTTLVFLVILLVLAVALYLVYVLNIMADQATKERAERLGLEYKPRPSWWNQMWQSMNASVPVAEEKDIELDHNFDGIKELDNHLPPWWKWLLYGTIAWSIAYLIIYHVTDSAPLSLEEYEAEMASAVTEKPKATIDEGTLTYTADQAMISNGKEIFIANCAPCHKNLGEGGVGPNLTDDYWLHGGDLKDIYRTINKGVPEKNMIAWETILGPEKIRDVAFFIMSIHGSNPPGAKAPQGDLYKPKSSGAAADTTKVQASLQ